MVFSTESRLVRRAVTSSVVPSLNPSHIDTRLNLLAQKVTEKDHDIIEVVDICL